MGVVLGRTIMVFADLSFNPGGIAACLAVGLIAGWLAGKLMADVSYGVVGEVLLGLAGGLVGGVAFGLFVRGEPSFWGAVLVALGGACIVVAAGRIIVSLRNA
jgi:uncharacterized membrane protein YeaQ/YmgE (transglycosylase-associated protein family)